MQVENCLLTHPAISEVSVVGLPDEKYGEVVAAFVVRRKGEEENLEEMHVRNWVREKLSHHLVPKYVFWAEDFPKTASGKVQRFKLRETGMQLIREGKWLG